MSSSWAAVAVIRVPFSAIFAAEVIWEVSRAAVPVINVLITCFSFFDDLLLNVLFFLFELFRRDRDVA